MFSKQLKQLPVLAGLLITIFWGSAVQGQLADEDAATRLSFGRVMPGEVVEQVIGFSIPGNDPVVVESIQLTPPLLAEDVTYLILPGTEGSFKLVLGDNRQPGPFEGTVRINFKDGKYPPIIFKIEGYIIPPVEFKPYPAFFIATHSGEQTTASIEIINHREQPLLLTKPKSDSDRFSTLLETLEAGQHYRLSLTLDGSNPAGKKQEYIVLQTDPPMEKPYRVQANTIIREPVYTFPDSVDLGALPLNVATDNDAVLTLSQTLMVYRPNTNDFELSVSIDLDFIKLESERGPDGDRYQLTLSLIPGMVKPGKVAGMVQIKTNDKKFSTLEIPITGYILD